MKPFILSTAVFLFAISNTLVAQRAVSLKLDRTTKKELRSKIDLLEKELERERGRSLEYASLYASTVQTHQEMLHEMNYNICTLHEQIDSIQTIARQPEKPVVVENPVEIDSSETTKIDPKLKTELLESCGCDVSAKNDLGNVGLGLKVLTTGYNMVMVKEEKVQGSCWDYINRVYSNAGFSGSKRKTVFSGKKGANYASQSMIKPGDWIYHVNHSFNDIGHSAIFICWKDYEKKLGVTLSHVGQNKLRPGKYGVYDLSHVYNIMRPAED